MPVAHEDTVLTQLRASWQAKHDEAQTLIDNPSATGEQLVKAERLFDERDHIGEQIEDRRGTLERVGQLRDRYTAGKSWAGEPIRGMPFSTAMGGDGSVRRYAADAGGASHFSVTGTEPAGSIELAFSPQRKHWEMISEAGPGTFGDQKWGLLSTFEYKRDWALYLRKGNRYADLCTKTLMEGMDDQGGVFAPAEFVARIIGRLPAPTQLRSLVTTLTTGRDMLIMPRKQYSADDKYTTAFRATWTGEIPSDGTGVMAAVNDAALLGNVEVPVHTAMLNAGLTRNWIEDAAFPVQAWLESELAQVIDLLYEDMILNGTGIGQPQGVYFGAASGNDGMTVNATLPEVVLSNTAGAIDYVLCNNMQTALAPQYENEGTRWVMNKKSALRALYNLMDNNNRPLFTTGMMDFGLVPRRVRMLLGDEIVLSQFSQNVSATTFPFIYGDLKGYYVAQRVGFSIQILDQTKAKANQIEMVGRVRFGGKPVEPFRLKIGKSNNT
jgi:HK97 family phage major capsid protein